MSLSCFSAFKHIRLRIGQNLTQRFEFVPKTIHYSQFASLEYFLALLYN